MTSPVDSPLARLEREAALSRRIQDLLLRFSAGISSTLNVGILLPSLAADINHLFGTRATAIWLHERRLRQLVRAASSSPATIPPGVRVDIESDAAPARGLRLQGPEWAGHGADRVLLVPLRGWRRALGALVLEAPASVEEALLLEGAGRLARQLSVTMENVQLLEEFLQQRRLLEDTFNSLIDLVAVVDTGLRVVQVNGVFAARARQTAAGALGQPIAAFIGAEMAAWLAAPEAQGSPTAARTRQFTDPQLAGIFSATVTPLINQQGLPVGRVLVARDVTAQVQLEAEREALTRRLAQSERLASLGQFVAGIAHEMNNPLQGVLGHLELLIRASEAAGPVRPTLRRIHREADRAARIVRNLLVFTGSRRMKRARLRPDRIVSRALASRAASLKRARIEVVRSQAEGLPSIEGDPLLLQQALLNILANAEHAAAGGARPPRIELAVQQGGDAGHVQIVVRDSGPGIAPEALPRIFDPFFTTKEVGQGTGLGLAITYGIIQEHGGRIEAVNLPDGGAQFIIELPVVPEGARKA